MAHSPAFWRIVHVFSIYDIIIHSVHNRFASMYPRHLGFGPISGARPYRKGSQGALLSFGCPDKFHSALEHVRLKQGKS